MRRRTVLAMLGGSAVVLPWTTRAQQRNEIPTLGILLSNPKSMPEIRAAFLSQLATLGWVENSTIRLAVRTGDGSAKQAAAYAQQLLAARPEILFAVNSVGTAALHGVTSSIPIVFAGVSDPVGAGFVQSLARPGGNLTGFTNYEYAMGTKWLDLLKQIAPDVTNVAVVYNPDNPGGRGHLASIEAASAKLGLHITGIGSLTSSGLEDALTHFARGERRAVLVTPSVTGLADAACVRLAARFRLVAIYPRRDSVISGGLLAYGYDPAEALGRAANYVSRILKGESPSELPVQAPSKYELVINMTAARAIGLAIPESVLARADEVIE